MDSSFYSNYSDVKFIDKLKENIDHCQAFYFSVSFIKKPGLRLLASNIEAAISRGAKGQIITSTYQNFTDIDSLVFFYDLANRYPDRFSCRLDRVFVVLLGISHQLKQKEKKENYYFSFFLN